MSRRHAHPVRRDRIDEALVILALIAAGLAGAAGLWLAYLMMWVLFA